MRRDEGHDEADVLGEVLDAMLRDPAEAERMLVALARGYRLLAAGEVAATLAHDVLNQLTVIGSCAAWLGSRPSTAAGDDAVAEIGAAVEQATALCRQVLHLCRPRRGGESAFDVNAAISAMAPLLDRVVAGAGKLRIDLLLWPSPLRTPGDESLFSNALLNLVLNARDAMSSGGRLAIRTALVGAGEAGDPDPRVRVDVVDTGVGIAAEVLPRVFDPFFTTKPHGTGLGLPSVRAAIERNGGAVRLTSDPGRGTTVTLLLPAERRTR